MANFLAAGGIAATLSEPLLQSTDAGRAFADSGATVACLCGADDSYADLGEAVAMLLKTVGAKPTQAAQRFLKQDQDDTTRRLEVDAVRQ